MKTTTLITLLALTVGAQSQQSFLEKSVYFPACSSDINSLCRTQDGQFNFPLDKISTPDEALLTQCLQPNLGSLSEECLKVVNQSNTETSEVQSETSQKEPVDPVIPDPQTDHPHAPRCHHLAKECEADLKRFCSHIPLPEEQHPDEKSEENQSEPQPGSSEFEFEPQLEEAQDDAQFDQKFFQLEPRSENNPHAQQEHGKGAHRPHGDNSHQEHGKGARRPHGDNSHQEHGNDHRRPHGDNSHQEHGNDHHRRPHGGEHSRQRHGNDHRRPHGDNSHQGHGNDHHRRPVDPHHRPDSPFRAMFQCLMRKENELSLQCAQAIHEIAERHQNKAVTVIANLTTLWYFPFLLFISLLLIIVPCGICCTRSKKCARGQSKNCNNEKENDQLLAVDMVGNGSPSENVEFDRFVNAPNVQYHFPTSEQPTSEQQSQQYIPLQQFVVVDGVTYAPVYLPRTN